MSTTSLLLLFSLHVYRSLDFYEPALLPHQTFLDPDRDPVDDLPTVPDRAKRPEVCQPAMFLAGMAGRMSAAIGDRCPKSGLQDGAVRKLRSSNSKPMGITME